MEAMIEARMKPMAVLAGMALFCAIAQAPLLAQEPPLARPPLAVRIVPRAGLFSPDAYLYEQYANFSGDGPVEWTDGYLGRALVLGIGVELGRPGGSLQVRAEVLHSFGGWLSVSRSVVVARQIFDPPHVETTWLDVPSAVTMGSLQLVIPTRLRIRSAQPYVLAGVMGKRNGFGDPTTPNDAGAILPSSGVTWGGDVGAGITVPVPGFIVDVQGRDAISRYWGKTQHDFVFSTGLLWRVR
jgi:hypothetical protein